MNVYLEKIHQQTKGYITNSTQVHKITISKTPKNLGWSDLVLSLDSIALKQKEVSHKGIRLSF